MRRFETFLPLTLTQWGGGGRGMCFEGNFDFIAEILFRFCGFGDFKISILIENYTSKENASVAFIVPGPTTK